MEKTSVTRRAIQLMQQPYHNNAALIVTAYNINRSRRQNNRFACVALHVEERYVRFYALMQNIFFKYVPPNEKLVLSFCLNAQYETLVRKTFIITSYDNRV